MDRRLRSPADLPIFAGVPTGIKDSDHVRFMGTRAGSKALAWVVSPIDSLLARRCRQGGFTILGKTSTSELTILPFVDTELAPPTRNPLHVDSYSGGSSGGASAAVAADMVPIAPGSDGAGSIRLPASFCGLVGFKPGRGVLFHEHKTVDPYEISSNGPIARNVRDAAALADVLAGRSTLASTANEGSFLGALDKPLRRLRIRWSTKSPLTVVDRTIATKIESLARVLAELGHDVEEGDPFEGTVEEFLPLMAHMMRTIPIPPWLEHRLQPTTRWMRDQGRGHSRASVLGVGERLARKVLANFGDADAWLLPTCARRPLYVGELSAMSGEEVFRAVVPIGAFTAPFNVSGQPAVSIPAGLDDTGMPIGAQIVGRPHRDRMVLKLAAELEAAMAPG